MKEYHHFDGNQTCKIKDPLPIGIVESLRENHVNRNKEPEN